MTFHRRWRYSCFDPEKSALALNSNYNILPLFLGVLKSISEIGVYSTILQLGSDHEQGPEVQAVHFMILVFASASNNKAAA